MTVSTGKPEVPQAAAAARDAAPADARATRDRTTGSGVPADAHRVLIVMTAAAVPLSYQLHAVGGWLILAVWPFSRLVHAWSVPVAYLRRKPIVYRARAPLAVRVGAGGLSSDRAAALANPPEGAARDTR